MILWRYILRAHVGPFIFANAIIIFLFLLQFLMKSAGDLVGKGLSSLVILELIALNLAWMVVLSVPMSVLVATVMAFGRLSADNEIAIMRTGGMSLYRMMAPVLVSAGFVTWGLTVFNNQILPEANIRLRTLMMDIIRIKPTLSLQAGVFTGEQELPNHRILVRKTFEKSNDLEGVIIYDLTRPGKNVVVTAERGVVSFSKDYTKVFMDLSDGEIHELNNEDMVEYRKIKFRRHRVSIPASGFGFERSDVETAQRDDRTMSSAMMQVIVDSARATRQRKLDRISERFRLHVQGYLDGKPELFSPAELPIHMQEERFLNRRRTRIDTQSVKMPVAYTSLSKQDTVNAVLRALTDARQIQSMVFGDISGIKYDDQQANKYLVEIYKKYSIPFACIVFALIGVPLGMMARRGGFGVGAGLSLGFFLFYWACLIGGEKLADRDILSPFLGMWIANMLLGVVGVLLIVRTARETTAIDWGRVQNLLPKSWRREAPVSHLNPLEGHETY